jgi:hypothetical protein
MNRDTWAAIGATIAVLAVVILGLLVTGGPGKQRLIQSDLRTVRSLGNLAQQIKFKWDSAGRVLPTDLEKFPESARQNPATNKSFTYRPKSGSEYELCATFLIDSRNVQAQDTNDFWDHPKGNYCFLLDASQQIPQIPYYY